MIEIKMTEDHECMINLSGRGGNIMEELAITKRNNKRSIRRNT